MSNLTFFSVIFVEILGLFLLWPIFDPLDEGNNRMQIVFNCGAIVGFIYTCETIYNAFHVFGQYFAGAHIIILAGFIYWQQKRISDAKKKISS